MGRGLCDDAKAADCIRSGTGEAFSEEEQRRSVSRVFPSGSGQEEDESHLAEHSLEEKHYETYAKRGAGLAAAVLARRPPGIGASRVSLVGQVSAGRR